MDDDGLREREASTHQASGGFRSSEDRVEIVRVCLVKLLISIDQEDRCADRGYYGGAVLIVNIKYLKK